MLRSFKSLELVRHYFSTEIQQATNFTYKESQKNTKTIASTVFATASSIGSTYFITNNWKPCSNIWNAIMYIGIYLITFILFYVFFLLTYRCYEKILIAFKVYGPPTISETKKNIDDFDHIACDCILVCFEFIEQYKVTLNNKELLSFYYYEVLYYLRKSIKFTLIIVDSPERYIKSPNDNVNGIDVFRVKNLSNLMHEITNFLIDNQQTLSLDNELQETLNFQITGLQNEISKIFEKCNRFIKDKY